MITGPEKEEPYEVDPSIGASNRYEEGYSGDSAEAPYEVYNRIRRQYLDAWIIQKIGQAPEQPEDSLAYVEMALSLEDAAAQEVRIIA